VELARFQELNRAYKARFEFPFILAVKGRSRGEILAAFETRLKNSPETEFETALSQVNEIARLRLEAIADAGR
jgi:OHCU decarboxylase